MMVSPDANGQLMPVIVVPKTASNRYVLIDGLRVCAMKKLKQDVIKAEIWSCSESDALLFLLTQQGQRTWEVLRKRRYYKYYEHAISYRKSKSREKLGEHKVGLVID